MLNIFSLASWSFVCLLWRNIYLDFMDSFKQSQMFTRGCSCKIYDLEGPGGAVVKEFTCRVGGTGDMGSIPGLGRSPGERNGNPLQYSCLGNPMDRGAQQAIAHGVAKSRTWLSMEHCLRAIPCVEEKNKVHTHCRQSKERKISKLNYARSISCSHLVNHKCSGGNLTLGKHE